MSNKLTAKMLKKMIREQLALKEFVNPESVFQFAIDRNDPEDLNFTLDDSDAEKAEKFAEMYFQQKISSQLDDNNINNIDFDEVENAVNDAYDFINRAFADYPDAVKIAKKKIAVLLNKKFYKTYGLSLKKWIHGGANSGSKDYLAQILNSIEDVADNDDNARDLTYDDATKGLLGSEAGYKELKDFLNLFKNKELNAHPVVKVFVRDIAAFAKNFLNSSINSYAEIPDDPDLDGFGKETNFALKGGKFDKLFDKSKDLDDVLEKFIDRIVDSAAGNDLTSAELDNLKNLTEDTDALELSDFVKAFNDADNNYQRALTAQNQTAANTARNDMAKYGRAIKKAKRIIDREIPQEFAILKKALQNKLKSIEDEKTAADTPFSGVSDSENYKNPQYMGTVEKPEFVGASLGFQDLLMQRGATGDAQRRAIYTKVDTLMRESFPAENISVKEKINLLNTTSDHIINGTSGDLGSIGEKLGRSAIVNTMSNAVNKLGGSEGGFVIEHILAQLTVGTQVGGDNGLGDLEVYSPAGLGAAADTGSLGSSKSYNKLAPISQANQNWASEIVNNPNRAISYFYLHKKDDGSTDLYFIGLNNFDPTAGSAPNTILTGDDGTPYIFKGTTRARRHWPAAEMFSGTHFKCYNIDGVELDNVLISGNNSNFKTDSDRSSGKNLEDAGHRGPFKGTQLMLYWANSKRGATHTVNPAHFFVGTLKTGETDEIARNSEEYVQNNINADISKMLKLINDLKKNIDKYMLGNDFDAGTDAMQNYIDLEHAILEGFEEKGKESGRQIGMKKGITGDAGSEQGVRYVQTDQGTFRVDAGGNRVKLTDDELAAIRENKMIQLDLMIENMVKQFIKGNLND